MPESSVKIKVSFESLMDSVSKLNLKEKLRLWELLERQIAQADEDLLEQDPQIKAEIEEARAAHQAQDYMTIDEYIAKKRKKPR